MSKNVSDKSFLFKGILLLLIASLILFFTICGILGVNAKRSEMVQQFFNELVDNSYTLPYTLLSKSMKETFYQSEDIFTLSAKVFINKIKELNEIDSKNFPRRFVARSPYIISVSDGTEISVDVFMIRTDQSNFDVIKDLFVFHASPGSHSMMEKIAVSMILEDGLWRVAGCRYRDFSLNTLDDENVKHFASLFQKSELLKLGNIFYEKTQFSKSMIFYEYYYQRLVYWSPETNKALDRLHVLWTDKEDSRLELLAQQIAMQKRLIDQEEMNQ